MAATNSWAARMAASSASGGGNFITRHGKYTMMVLECSGKVGPDVGFKGESIAVRLRVVEAARNGLSGDIGPHEIGDSLSVVFNFTKQPEMAPGKLKALVLALTGKQEKEVSEKQMTAFGESMILPRQPLTGKLVRCET